MTYQETLDFLFNQLPSYQIIGGKAYKANLNNITFVCNHLNNPQNNFKSIHVGGTNGKGSVCHYLASVLQEAGYTVGTYSSPHLIDFRERIKVNGEMISEEKVAEFVTKNKSLFEANDISFFEYTTALAFQYFSDQKVDFGIIEVGLGGRLDSTNIINPLLSIITNISLDHTSILGNSVSEIAKEKSGIIKPETPVIIGKYDKESAATIESVAKENNSSIEYANRYDTEDYRIENINTVKSAIAALIKQGYQISKKAMDAGIENVSRNTALTGRWQKVSKNPATIIDVGHNEAGVQKIIELLRNEKFNRLHIIWGSVSDKDQDKILSLLPKDATYYFCAPNIERALPVKELAELARKKGLKGSDHVSVEKAYHAASIEADNEDLIFVGGSTFVVADFLLSLPKK